ncbi:putative glycine dehydrogenase (decarboxylating) subunit 1 [Posidoniimonas polymericola]|uniref:Probable glycine dehydrogenase (decarboxylating) subunit 1 n=1 Tax=Posidoniimonas polymericola TaxID=2528002 RepID=A0A5C5YRB4_9BACT|nr:aminomethyl-transferring glycine dehydrogenase subunit GcvPA [Posidoniimonas polymericola]TWT77481.1 putative glycine dehydrogenase (decarboxylating) subunit 1 [Posidoniimonas polymericola]
MPYTYNTPEDVAEMLAAIGAESIEELYDMVPSDLRLGRPLDLPPALGEMELDQHMRKLSGMNASTANSVCFLGGGSYDHFVPAVVDVVASRSEFYTSYTPYQPEVAQGNLQAMFEYQSLITRLTGLDISNSSLYDGATAAAEAVLMAIAATRRSGRVVMPASVHPEYRGTVETYLECLGVEVVTVPAPGGVVDVDELRAELNDQTAAVLLQQPNFFGAIEDAEAIGAAAHEAGALFIVAFDPISLGLLKRPGDYDCGGWGADIAVAEGQSLGSPMQYGGPYLGVMACTEKLVRRMPGRIVGQTTDRRGKRCFTLTLQTREQHIRRDKATSNVCSNQGLFALRATVYLSLLGPEGLKETANLCLQKSRYLADQLVATERFEPAFDQPTFKEFVVRDRENKVEELIKTALDQGVLAGVPLGQFYPELSDCLLIAVTEKRTREEIDALVGLLTGAAVGTAPVTTA